MSEGKPPPWRESFDEMIKAARETVEAYDRDPKPEDLPLTQYIKTMRSAVAGYDESALNRKRRERAMNELRANGSFERTGMMLSNELAVVDEWDRWRKEIPFIEFPAGWRVKVTPPFMGAQVRFMVLLPGAAEADAVSVYLDCYSRLGFYPGPYWEVYPHQGDTGRCAMGDVARLIEMIADRSEGAAEENEDV